MSVILHVLESEH